MRARTSVGADRIALNPDTPVETYRLGALVGSAVVPGDMIALIGPLGSGKTTFAEGVAAGIGVSSWGGSPSFPLMHDYRRDAQARLPLLHADFYRLTDPIAIHDLGFEEYLRGNYVVVVEWPEIALSLLPSDRLTLTFSIVGDSRSIVVRAPGARGRALARAFG